VNGYTAIVALALIEASARVSLYWHRNRTAIRKTQLAVKARETA
jgi:hypothetical protein